MLDGSRAQETEQPSEGAGPEEEEPVKEAVSLLERIAQNESGKGSRGSASGQAKQRIRVTKRKPSQFQTTNPDLKVVDQAEDYAPRRAPNVKDVATESPFESSLTKDREGPESQEAGGQVQQADKGSSPDGVQAAPGDAAFIREQIDTQLVTLQQEMEYLRTVLVKE